MNAWVAANFCLPITFVKIGWFISATLIYFSAPLLKRGSGMHRCQLEVEDSSETFAINIFSDLINQERTEK